MPVDAAAVRGDDGVGIDGSGSWSGWTYDSVSNAVIYDAGSALADGAEVKIGCEVTGC